MTWKLLKPKKIRIPLAWIGCALLFWMAHIDDRSFQVGVPIAIIGEVIRIWALIFMEKKGEVLATDGPFAFLRNPLYVGNFLIGLGSVVICRNVLLFVLFLIGFTVLYVRVIKEEEAELLGRFGEQFLRYCREVPRFFPRLTPYPARTKTSLQWKRLWKHHEYITLMGLSILMMSFYLWEEIILQGEFQYKEVIVIGIGAVILTAVVLLEINKVISFVANQLRN